MSLTIRSLEEWLGNGILQVNLKFNDLSEIVNFCDKKGDLMVKKNTDTSVFGTKTAEERGDFVKNNPGVMLSGVNFHMLFQIYKTACKNDPKYTEFVKRYTKKQK